MSSHPPTDSAASRSARARSTARRVLVSAATGAGTRPLRTRSAASTGPSSVTSRFSADAGASATRER